MLFPYTIKSICDQYNKCPVLIEANSDVGGIVAVSMYYDLEYENVILSSSDMNKYGIRIGGFNKSYPGVKTTHKVKYQGCTSLRTLIESEKLIINDYDIIAELGTFISKGKSFEADEGCHDDTVMTLVLFGYLVKQDWFIDYTSENVQGTLFKEKRDNNEFDMLPFGFIENQYTTSEDNGFKMTDGVESNLTLEQWMNM